MAVNENMEYGIDANDSRKANGCGTEMSIFFLLPRGG